MATLQYTAEAQPNAWPSAAAYTASGSTDLAITNPDPLKTVYIWIQASATAPTFAPALGIAIPAQEVFYVTLADGENVFGSALVGKTINFVE